MPVTNISNRKPSSGAAANADDSAPRRAVAVTLLGAGTVNGELARMLAERPRAGDIELQVTQALVRDASRPRDGLANARLFADPASIDVERAGVVVEALGGIHPARELLLRALNAGVPVVTANKTLIAYHGEELLAAARASGAALRFEAAVGAATPCIRVLRETLKGVTVRRIHGVLNGTSHFILNEIRNPGMSLETAVALAQQHGYAEADPSADLDGHDAAQKLAILCWCLSGTLLDPEKIPRVELPALSPETVIAAAHIGFSVKPLAALSWLADGTPEAWIAPAAVPARSPLASTGGAEATVVIQTRRAGTLTLTAPGAGGGPTASALYDDLVDVAGNASPAVLHSGSPSRIDPGGADDPREWAVHVPHGSSFDGVKLIRHIALCGGGVERFEALGAGGWIAYVSGMGYDPDFTEPLSKAGACVLEVVR